MRNEEKKIIAFSVLVLVIVIVWAGIVNVKNHSKVRLSSTKNQVVNNESNTNTTEEVKNSSVANTSEAVNSQVAVKMKSNNEGIPVLMYHSVSNDKPTDKLASLRITMDSFLQQMEYLKNNNFTTLTLDELKDFIISNKQVPEKSVVLTFDDGYEDNYTNVYPILKKYGFKATIFIETSSVDNNKNMLTSAQLVELQQNGIDIESETAQDDKLASLSSVNQLKSMQNSKQYLEKLLNKTVNYISYPYGSYNKDTLDAAAKAGYILGLSRDGKWTYKTDGNYKLSRVYVGPKHTIDNFTDRLNNPNYNY